MALTLSQAAALSGAPQWRQRVIAGAIRHASWVMAQDDGELERLQVTATGLRQEAQAILGRASEDSMQRRLALVVASWGPLVAETVDGNVDQSTIGDDRIEAALQALLPALVNAGEVRRPAPGGRGA
jgi:hypothetical protein